MSRLPFSFQVTSNAAEVYDEFFVPALFGAWGTRMVAAANVQAGMRVIDVACGTGVLAIEAARATKPGGQVVGVDLNPGMLAVARRKSNEVEWRQAPAEELEGEARFPSIRSWMHTDVRGWTLAHHIDDAQFERLVSEADKELSSFVMNDGSVRFAQPALIARATNQVRGASRPSLTSHS